MQIGFVLRNIVMHGSQLRLASWTPGGLRVTHNAYFSLLTHTKKLLLVTLSDLTAETGVSFWKDGWTTEDGGRTDGGT